MYLVAHSVMCGVASRGAVTPPNGGKIRVNTLISAPRPLHTTVQLPIVVLFVLL